MRNLNYVFRRWLDVGTVNPERDEAKMPVLLLWVERLAIVVVAVVSGVAVAAYGYLLASGYTSIVWLRYLSAGVFFALATAITDVGVKYFIQKSAYDLLATFNPITYKKKLMPYDANKHGPRQDLIDVDGVEHVLVHEYNYYQRAMQVLVWLCMVGIIGGLFYFDYISVESVRRPVANMVKQEKKVNQDSIRALVLDQEKARVEVTSNAISLSQAAVKQLQREVKATENRVERENAALTKLIAKGNGWAANELRKKKAAATAGLQKQIDREQENISFLREQQGLVIADGRNVVAKSDSSVLATNAAIEKRNTDLVTGTSTMFIWLGFWAKCIAAIIRILLVAMFLAGNVQDYNKDGEIDYRDVTAAAPLGFQAP